MEVFEVGLGRGLGRGLALDLEGSRAAKKSCIAACSKFCIA